MAMDGDVEVPDSEHPRIVVDDMFGGEPRIAGRRISVLDVYDQVQEGAGDFATEEFAETFGLDLADIYHALAYYHTHSDEMKRHRDARDQAFGELEEHVVQNRPSGVEPD